jgi:hypothetical protein
VNARNVILTMVDGYTPETDMAKLEEAAFTEVTARFGFASNADAKRALDAINACFATAQPLIDPLMSLFDTFR